MGALIEPPSYWQNHTAKGFYHVEIDVTSACKVSYGRMSWLLMVTARNVVLKTPEGEGVRVEDCCHPKTAVEFVGPCSIHESYLLLNYVTLW